MKLLSKFIRKGMYRGHVYVFTHWNPSTNEVWSDDIENGPKVPDGAWVRQESVKWIKEGKA